MKIGHKGEMVLMGGREIGPRGAVERAGIIDWKRRTVDSWPAVIEVADAAIRIKDNASAARMAEALRRHATAARAGRDPGGFRNAFDGLLRQFRRVSGGEA